MLSVDAAYCRHYPSAYRISEELPTEFQWRTWLSSARAREPVYNKSRKDYCVMSLSDRRSGVRSSITMCLLVFGYIMSTADLYVYRHCLKTKCFRSKFVSRFEHIHSLTHLSSRSPKERLTNVLISAEWWRFCQGWILSNDFARCVHQVRDKIFRIALIGCTGNGFSTGCLS